MADQTVQRICQKIKCHGHQSPKSLNVSLSQRCGTVQNISLQVFIPKTMYDFHLRQNNVSKVKGKKN